MRRLTVGRPGADPVRVLVPPRPDADQLPEPGPDWSDPAPGDGVLVLRTGVALVGLPPVGPAGTAVLDGPAEPDRPWTVALLTLAAATGLAGPGDVVLDEPATAALVARRYDGARPVGRAELGDARWPGLSVVGAAVWRDGDGGSDGGSGGAVLGAAVCDLDVLDVGWSDAWLADVADVVPGSGRDGGVAFALGCVDWAVGRVEVEARLPGREDRVVTGFDHEHRAAAGPTLAGEHPDPVRTDWAEVLGRPLGARLDSERIARLPVALFVVTRDPEEDPLDSELAQACERLLPSGSAAVRAVDPGLPDQPPRLVDLVRGGARYRGDTGLRAAPPGSPPGPESPSGPAPEPSGPAPEPLGPAPVRPIPWRIGAPVAVGAAVVVTLVVGLVTGRDDVSTGTFLLILAGTAVFTALVLLLAVAGTNRNIRRRNRSERPTRDGE